MIANAHVTVYNKYIDAAREKYQRAEIRNVTWQGTKAANAANVGLIAANSATIYIPFENATEYQKPKAWQANRQGWTLAEGDVIVKGIVAEEITAIFTLTALKAKYDDVLVITSVDTMDMGSSRMQHFQVGAK